MKKKEKKKILILGGTGFVGNSVYKYLRKNNTVKILSISKGGDLRKVNTLTNYFKNNLMPDIIINCAAHVGGIKYLSKKPADVMTDNIQIYTNIYKALINLQNKPIIINLISNCFYPEKLKVQVEDKWQDGQMHKSVEAFGISKRLLLIFSKNYHTQYNVKSYNLILPNAFGPGDHLDPERSHALNAIIIRMKETLRKKEKIFEVWGSGKPRREWIFVNDICKIVSQLIKKNINNNIVLNIAQNKSYSINEIAFLIKNIFKFNGKIINNTNYADGAPLKQLCNKKFKKFFKNFKFTDFEHAINKTIKSYKNIKY